MAETARFNISFLRTKARSEDLFVSVTPGFEHGPGIQRDGITPPRMRDPHSVPFVCDARSIEPRTLPPTTNAYVQRAGTWTIYHHLKEFVKHHGEKRTIIGVQSCGDLTMNPWHVAYLGNSYLQKQTGTLAGLLTQNDPQEPTGSRIYRCMVKWKDDLKFTPPSPYQFLDLTFHDIRGGYGINVKNLDKEPETEEWLAQVSDHSSRITNIASFLEFALSGKPIVEKSVELSLSNAIDRFEDIRHIFNLPTVRARGAYQGEKVPTINFGEYQLFQNLNERRAALSSAVIVDLRIGDFVTVEWKDLRKTLLGRHFKETAESPTRRGFFRRYADDISRDKVEIFFPHNVYPFGVIGTHEDVMVCLASGGLSGRVGNTLEGITRIMFDFFGCEDSMVLDEGYDTFQIVNPPLDGGSYQYSNEAMLRKVLGFTKQMVDREHMKSLDDAQEYSFSGGMKEWPLNAPLCLEIDSDASEVDAEDFDDIMAVPPHRSQMRSVLIFTTTKSTSPVPA